MSNISAMTVKYWTDTLLGWAEDRLMPPQFDECKASLEQLIASAERTEQAEKSRDKMTEAYYKRKERSEEVEKQLGAARAQVQRLREASRAVLTLFYDTGVYRHPYQQEILDKAEDVLRDTEPHGGQ